MEVKMELHKTLEELRRNFKSGTTRNASWRKAQLSALLHLLRHCEEKIFAALNEDLGKDPVESYRDEIGVVEKSTKHSLSHIDQWMAPKKCRLPLVMFPTTGEVLPEPLGLVLVFSCWNFPISLALDPLVGAISAGNAVVIKPSELAPACATLLANLIPVYLDGSFIKVIVGGADVSATLLQHKWDKIFFTGSPRVGRIVMSAAAKHLTPVTLELGGKCPAIMDSLSSPSDLRVGLAYLPIGQPKCGLK